MNNGWRNNPAWVKYYKARDQLRVMRQIQAMQIGAEIEAQKQRMEFQRSEMPWVEVKPSFWDKFMAENETG